MLFNNLRKTLERAAQFGVIALCLFVPGSKEVRAQSDSSLGAALELLQDRLRAQGGGLSADRSLESPELRTLRPNLPYAYRLPMSDLEKYYSERAGTDLRQFGYESFGRPAVVTVRQMGALQDTYILGVGDQVRVDIRGQDNRTFTVDVNRDGNIVLPALQPIPAAGRRLGDVRADIEEKVKSAYIATQAFVSVGALRQISILVSGEVLAPGAIVLNALNSPIDALLLAGGIKKTGSLRNIQVVRGNQQLAVDLYSVLSAADGMLQQSLTDGDKITVPTVGDTVAIVGEVTRPGIFEVAPGEESIAVSKLLALAGGYTRGGAPRLSVLKVRSDGTEVMTPIGSASEAALRKGDILFVQPSGEVARGRVVLEGQVRVPGTFDLTRTPTLKALLRSPDVFEEEPYMVFGAISRRDPATLSRTLVPFAPLQVVQGQADIPLQDDDIVRVFSVPEVRSLAKQLAVELDLRNPASVDLRTAPTRDADTGQAEDRVQGQADTSLRRSQGTVGAALAGRPRSQGLTSLQAGQLDTRQLQQYQDNLSSAAAGQLYLPNGSLSANLLPQASGELDQGYFAPEGYPQVALGSSSLYPDRLSRSDYLSQLPLTDRETRYDREQEPFSSRNLKFDLKDPSIRSQISGYLVSLLGAVQVPGEYLAAPGVGLVGLVGAAGGLTVTADLTGIEVTSTVFDSETGRAETTRASFNVTRSQLDRIAVRPRDVVRFREVYSDRDGGQIVVRGQVRFPGAFDMLRGERLSSVLARAGGLTDVAYPSGAVFTRESAARAEEDGYRRAAEELERQFTVLVADQNVTPQGVQFIRETIDRLQTATGVGRISVEADPVVLMATPQRDMILEPGDFLFLPRRPNSVSVTGEVLSAGSFLFRTGEGGRHYIDLAGGFAPAADKRRTFVLMPDGTARPLNSSLLRFRQADIVPGATIIVPRDLTPFRLNKVALDLTQILSQLAVSAASIAVISRNN